MFIGLCVTLGVFDAGVHAYRHGCASRWFVCVLFNRAKGAGFASMS
jgi:hypothetical protein